MAGHNGTYGGEVKRLLDMVENLQEGNNLEQLLADDRAMLNYAISGFSRGVGQICAILRYNAAQSDNSVPTLMDNQLALYSRAKNFLS
jgi:hypothetical protein